MTDIPFHATVQGRRFFEGTLPRLVEQLEKLNANLAELVKTMKERTSEEDEDG